MTMRVLVVDDEPLARQRLVQLLGKLSEPAVQVLAQCQDAGSALAWLEGHPGQAHVCFLDIQMPGPDGLRLADKLSTLDPAPLVVFVTAHSEHACRAFELQAVDYLTKPVRLERLVQAVARCNRQMSQMQNAAGQSDEPAGELVIQERQRVVRIKHADIVYLRAEQKYVTVRTLAGQYVLDDSLTDLEPRLGEAFIRIHRNALVAKTAIRELVRLDDSSAGEGWFVRLVGLDETLAVSRRQVSALRELLASA